MPINANIKHLHLKKRFIFGFKSNENLISKLEWNYDDNLFQKWI